MLALSCAEHLAGQVQRLGLQITSKRWAGVLSDRRQSLLHAAHLAVQDPPAMGAAHLQVPTGPRTLGALRNNINVSIQ